MQLADLQFGGVLLREQPHLVLSDRLVVLLLQLEHTLLEGHDLIRLLRQLSVEVLEDVLLVLLLLHEARLELLTLIAVGAALVLGEILLEQADLCLQELTVCRAAWPVDVPLLGKYGADIVVERRPEDRAPVGESQAWGEFWRWRQGKGALHIGKQPMFQGGGSVSRRAHPREGREVRYM